MELPEAAAVLARFAGNDLGLSLARLETQLRGRDAHACGEALLASGADESLLAAAGVMKRAAGQVNVLVHAIGIVLCLPRLLRPGERITSVSLGAGNTGRPYDIETDQRIAEFKFIRWRGGPESIRQNSLFKDFYLMAEDPDEREKYLYVLGTDYPLKFLNGGRALSSVLSRNVRLQEAFRRRYGARFQRVNEYYDWRREAVRIEDVSAFVPGLSESDLATEEPGDNGG
jgi:hypothetical protein